MQMCTEVRVLSKTGLSSAFTLTKNTRMVTLQDIPLLNVTSGGPESDNFSLGISEKLPKIATSNLIFSRTADRITAKFCMTIKKIKPNDIIQNCVHSTSTLTEPENYHFQVINK